MEQLEQYELGLTHEESPDFLESEIPENEEVGVGHDPSSTDDPVRVYLREMGSIRLLSRQGEIALARRMERGKLKVEKALSRSPLVWRAALAAFNETRQGLAPLEELVVAASAKARNELTLRFANLSRLDRQIAV